MKGVIIFVLAVQLALSGIQVYQTVEASHRRSDICHAVGNLNAVISQTLERSKKNLDTLEYYKHHPKEKAQQKREINRTLALFAPHPCN